MFPQRSVAMLRRTTSKERLLQRRTPNEPSRGRSYAVTWLEGGSVRAGKLVLESTKLRLESGGPRGRLSTRALRYDDLSAVEMTSRPEERIQGRPTALVKRAGRAPLAIATVDRLGSLRELVERLAGAAAGLGTSTDDLRQGR